MAEAGSTPTTVESGGAPQSAPAKLSTAIDPNAVAQAPVETPKEVVAPKAPPAKEKLSIDGQEFEMSIDDMRAELQKRFTASKRFEEAKKLRQAAEQRLQEVEAKERYIRDVTSKHGDDAFKLLIESSQNDPQKMAAIRGAMENYLVEQIKLEQADPQTQEYLKMKREMEAMKAEREAQRKQQEQEQFQRVVEQQKAVIQKEIIAALDASGLPPTEWNIKKMADLKIKCLRNKYNPSPEQLAAMVKDDTIENVRVFGGEMIKPIAEMFKAGKYDDVVKLGGRLTDVYGEELLNALRYFDLAKTRINQAPMPKPVIETPKVPVEANTKPMSMDEWREERKRIVEGLQAEWKRA